ncbi:hypothetical protein C9374_003979 [Naegleria lovaniensis]|uniref:RGS domain-containing protein n=1 Tax=Naegleria lovaniensis TaxID=51637 RepID=A0AA88H420_NAELO|nr:uncharacterized protein C9374_003979 [Naegleria lovaniensis]KAG2394215.1 hypothetical protein C9374_003979 [Naegleria lovaniensis]
MWPYPPRPTLYTCLRSFPHLLFTLYFFLSSINIFIIHCASFPHPPPNHAPLQTSSSTSSNVQTLDLLVSDRNSIQQTLKTSRVIGVSEYVFFYVWRDKFMQRFKNIMVKQPETLHELFDKISQTHDTTTLPSVLSISSDSTYFSIFNERFMKTMFPGNYSIRTSAISSTIDCLTGNTMVDVDAFIQSSSPAFFVRFKNNRHVLESTGQWTSLQDLWMYPLMPRTLLVLPKLGTMENGTEIIYYLKSLIQNQTQYLTTNQQCGTETIVNRDSAWIHYGFSFLNFTSNDLQVVGKVWNVTVEYDQQYLSQLFTSQDLGVTFNQTLESVSSMVSRSNCNYCPYSICFTLDGQDYASYISIGIAMIYYIIFFSTGMFKNYAMQRRLILPYLPIFGMLRNWSNTTLSEHVCFSVFRILALFSVLVILAVYFVTTIRFFYLRNLYTIMSKTKFDSSPWTIKIHKMLSSALGGIIFSVLAAIAFNIVVLIPISTPLVVMRMYAGINYTGVAVVILAVVLSTGTFIVDAILNRSNIKRFGIWKFLLFDDPFYLRIDLICTVLILLFLIIYIVTLAVVGVVYAVMDVLISICIIQVCGGNVMIFELGKRIIFSKRHVENGELEKLLRHNKEFHALISEYSAKEFSYENIAFFEFLYDYKAGRKSMDLNTLKQMEEQFVSPYSKFEVNLPSQVKKDLGDLIRQLNNHELHEKEEKEKKEKVILGLFVELVKNLSDTYQRMQQTKQYLNWRAVYTVQQEAHVVAPVD